MTNENSGRYEIAEVLARVFPRYRAFAIRVLESMDFQLPTGPYPKDILTRRGQRIVEYETPAQTEGLGNFHSWLGKNDLPIQGAAIIVGDSADAGAGLDVVLLSLRLPLSLTGVVPAIISQFERDTARPDR